MLSWKVFPRERIPTRSARIDDGNLHLADRWWCLDATGRDLDRGGALHGDPTAPRRHRAHPGGGGASGVRPGQQADRCRTRRVRDVLTSDRFVDLAPLQIYAQLLDESRYLCSVSTMYRVLAENALARALTGMVGGSDAPFLHRSAVIHRLGHLLAHRMMTSAASPGRLTQRSRTDGFRRGLLIAYPDRRSRAAMSIDPNRSSKADIRCGGTCLISVRSCRSRASAAWPR